MTGGGLELAVVFLLAAVIAVPVFRRFGLGAVLGYLAAGVVLGPFGLRVIRDAEPVLAASEIGVVMMLFVIGLELSPARLKVMRRPVFGAGGAQMLITGLVLGLLATMAGFGWKTALVVGLGLALSSTAVGLQLLSERKALGSEHGRKRSIQSEFGGSACRGRSVSASAPVSIRRAVVDARGIYRCGPAGSAGFGAVDGERGVVGRPGRISRRGTAG